MYAINDRRFSPDDAGLQVALRSAYDARIRPLCCCKKVGIAMYIAKVGGSHVLKRMPNTGGQHAGTCVSYEPPAHWSGLGGVLGGAILNAADGPTSLRLDFAMSRKGAMKSIGGEGSEAGDVSAPGNNLSLRGLFHYLLDQAGLTRWSPAMEGKRNWRVIRKYLLRAADGMVVKGRPLAERLFIPETFSVEAKAEIAQRHRKVFQGISRQANGALPLLLLVAEVKELRPGKLAANLRVKHMPDSPFLVCSELYRRILRRFEPELSLWNGVDSSHLIVVATFGVSVSGVPTVEQMTLTVLDERWQVLEASADKVLLDALTRQQRHFIRSLRYELPKSSSLPAAILVDCFDPVPLYVVSGSPDGAFKNAIVNDFESPPLWVWNVAEELPELPPARSTLEL